MFTFLAADVGCCLPPWPEDGPQKLFRPRPLKHHRKSSCLQISASKRKCVVDFPVSGHRRDNTCSTRNYPKPIQNQHVCRFPRIWLLMLAVACPLRLKMVIKRAKMALKSSTLVSRWHSRAPRWLQDAPQIPPICPKMALKSST